MAAGENWPEEVWVEIIDRLSEGEPLQEICRTNGFPKPRTVYDKREQDSDYAAEFGRARDAGHDAIAARLRETARGLGDSSGDVQRDKLIIDTDFKLLSKWDPRKYGDKLALGGDADAPPITVQTIKRVIVKPDTDGQES